MNTSNITPDYQALFDSYPESVFILNPSGQILAANHMASVHLGYSNEQLLAMRFIDLVSPDISNDFEENFCRAENADIRLNSIFHSSTGSFYKVDIAVKKILHRGEPALLATVRDISSNDDVELLQSELRYRTLFENNTMGVGYHQVVFEGEHAVDYIFLERNAAADKLSGLSDVVGKKLTDIIPDVNKTNPQLLERYGRVARTGKPEHFEDYYPALQKWYFSTLYALPGHIVVSIFDDITARKKAEISLMESEERYRSLFENMTSGFVLFEAVQDEQGSVVDLLILAGNKEFENTTGLNMKDVTGKHLSQVLPGIENDTAGWIKIYGEVAMTGKPRQFSQGSELLGYEYEVTAYPAGPKQCAVAFLDISTEKELERQRLKSSRKQIKALKDTVKVIATALEFRDPYTTGHQENVAFLCRKIAEKLGLAEFRIVGLELGATIHDIGKISIPAELLTKPSRLTDIEFSLIKNHSKVGFEIVSRVDFPWPIAQMILQHHERLDGSGYPDGIAGDAIILEARILAVADVAEAISSHRPYRASLGIDVALKELTANRGTLYDAKVVDACIKVLKDKHFSFVKPAPPPPTA